MHWLALGSALLLALAIIAIGMSYLLTPETAARSFGLPLPSFDSPVAWWLRLKGVRDIVSGLVVLVSLALAPSRWVGVILLVETLIPVGDMLLILAAKGAARRAFGIHGVTALVMMVTSLSLAMGLV